MCIRDREVRNLRERIENVQLRLRLQGRTVPVIEDNVFEGASYSVNEESPLLSVEEMPETRRPWCFKHGKGVCCLFTTMVLSVILSFLLGGAGFVDYVCCPSFGCEPFLCSEENSLGSLLIGVSSQIGTSFVLTFVPVSYTHLTLPTKA